MTRVSMRTAPLLAALALAAAPAASARSVTVDDDRGDCGRAEFTSIQAAVAASGERDTVRVCPGTYAEQVRIGPGRDGLKLRSVRRLEARIVPPPAAAPPRALVTVTGAERVRVRGFTISGPFATAACDVAQADPHAGVQVAGGGSARIDANRITLIRTAAPGCPDGVGVAVGRSAAGPPGTAIVRHNRIDRYGRSGVLVSNPGSSAEIEHNTVGGPRPVGLVAPNGIQVSEGAAARVRHNEVFGNVSAEPDRPGAGIVLDAPRAGADGGRPAVAVERNDVHDNDDGIELLDGTVGALVARNHSHDNRLLDGIFAAADTRENVLEENRAVRNAGFDCRDDSRGSRTAGTANLWRNNEGVTESPPGICRRGESGDAAGGPVPALVPPPPAAGGERGLGDEHPGRGRGGSRPGADDRGRGRGRGGERRPGG